MGIAGALLLGGCTAADGGTDAGGAVQFDDAKRAQAQANVDALTAVPTYNGPTEPLDLSLVKGKKLYMIAFDLSNDFNRRLADSFDEAAKLAGAEAVLLSSGVDSGVASSYIDQAIADGAAGIVLLSIGVEQVPSAIANAAAAGIPVITMAQTSAGSEPGEGIVNQVTVNTTQIGATQVDLAYLASGEGLNVVGYGGYVLPQDVSQLEGQKARMAELGLEDSFEMKDVNLNSFQTALPGMVQAEIVSNPKVNWALPTWDVLGTYVLPGIRSAQAEGRVQMSTWNGIPAAMELVQDGEQAGVFGVPLRWWGWATFDMLARYVAGQDVAPDAENLPVRLFTTEMLVDMEDVTDEQALYENDHVFDTYRELWGLGG
jgi:ribose transport system substrate-binding protein